MRTAFALQLGAVIFALTLSIGHAQVKISLTPDKKSYLQYEPVKITVRIENNSGNTLTFNNPDSKKPLQSYIRCVVMNEQNERVSETKDSIKRLGKGNVNMAKGFVLPAGGKSSLTIEVNRYYKMSTSQDYSVAVIVRHKRFGKDFLSDDVDVSIISGVTKVKEIIGLPAGYDDSSTVIKERVCELVSFSGARHTEYALRISDDDYTYCTVRLSRHLEGDKPGLKIDARSHIHIIVQTHPKIFTYWLFDYKGTLKQMSFYRYRKHLGVPKLHKDPDIGRVIVDGGERYIPEEDEEIDLPEYRSEDLKE